MVDHSLPDGTLAAEWVASPATSNHHTRIDEDDVTLNISDYVYTTHAEYNDLYTMDSPTLIGNIETIIAWVYAYRAPSGVSNDFKITPYVNGSPLAEKIIPTGESAAWCSESWSGLNLDQADINTLQILFRAPSTIPSGKFILVYALYVECIELGWGHKLAGVSNPSKIMGVSSYSKVKGV